MAWRFRDGAYGRIKWLSQPAFGMDVTVQRAVAISCALPAVLPELTVRAADNAKLKIECMAACQQAALKPRRSQENPGIDRLHNQGRK
jgi:hypothetical protein